MTVYTSDLLRPIAGNTYVPDSMETKGRPLPVPPFPGVENGVGELVRAGNYAVDWTFPVLTKTDIDWWKDLLDYVSGSRTSGASKRFVTAALPAARLWDITGTMVDYGVAVIHMPTWTEYKNGLFYNCVVKFRRLEESL